MRLGKYLSGLTKPELEILQENLNLTDDELIIFQYLSKGRSQIEVVEVTRLSIAGVNRRIENIKCKIRNLNQERS